MPAASTITASILYALVQCPHRVWLDANGDFAMKDPANPFVELLWERGNKYEREVVAGLGRPFVDLSALPAPQKEAETTAAMRRGEPLIYGGRISSDDLVGVPDLLRKEGAGYVAGDIKSGAGKEGSEGDEGKLKKHYAVQLALYTEILESLGQSASRRAFVWDIHGDEVTYEFNSPQGPKTPETLWQFYERTLVSARRILGGHEVTLPASASVCKLCHWYTFCRESVKKTDDLTQVAELGRTRRDAMIDKIATVETLSVVNPDAFIRGKKTDFKRIGPDLLRRFHERARLLKTNGARPYLKLPVRLPATPRELHLDIETDPMRDHVYMHGFVLRDAADGSQVFKPIVAEAPTQDAERAAFAAALGVIRDESSATLYVYSSYERTTYRKLQERYPDIATAEEIEELFAEPRSIDLYRVVRTSTEWPTWDQSIKTLAKYLGFSWRDTNPSGAASIEWYDKFIQTGDRSHLERILQYNEDDCRAMVVLLDAIRAM